MKNTSLYILFFYTIPILFAFHSDNCVVAESVSPLTQYFEYRSSLHTFHKKINILYTRQKVIHENYHFNLLLEHHDKQQYIPCCNKLMSIRGGSTYQEHDEVNQPSTMKKKRHKKKKKKRKIRKDKEVISKTPVSEQKLQRGLDGANINVKQKRKNQKGKKSLSSSIGGGKQGECLRRIKHEWKQIIKLGVAYDWVSKQTITPKDSKSRSDDHFYKHNYVRIGPFRNNLLHWHFSIQGPKNSVYEEGIYHGRIILPKDYPGSPPRVQVLTPSGRFIPGDDICLSASAFHPETWTPRWTITSLVEALRMHMLTTANEIGGMNSSYETRKKLALYSRSWKMGCFNHEQMVRDGLFCSRQIDDKELLDDGQELESCERCDFVDLEGEDFIYEEDESIGDEAVVGFEQNNITTIVECIAAAKENDEVHPAPIHISKRKNRIQRRPEKQKVAVIILRGVIEFFLRHIELGILFLVIILFFK
jgi:ubiquitin-protein ligase